MQILFLLQPSFSQVVLIYFLCFQQEIFDNLLSTDLSVCFANWWRVVDQCIDIHREVKKNAS